MVFQRPTLQEVLKEIYSEESALGLDDHNPSSQSCGLIFTSLVLRHQCPSPCCVMVNDKIFISQLSFLDTALRYHNLYMTCEC